jgi:hypothetical protein
MRGIQHSTTVLLLALAASALLTSCSHNRIIDLDDARSEVRSAISLVAESALFVEYVRQGRATRRYADGHATYLQGAVRQSLDELKRSEPAPRAAAAIRECRIQLELLDRELAGFPAAFGHGEALAAAGKRIRGMRASLEKAGSSL